MSSSSRWLAGGCLLNLFLLSWMPSDGLAGDPQGRRKSAIPIDRSFSLTPRFQVGQKSSYRFVSRQFVLAEGQGVVARIQLSGDFEREVVEVKPDGSAIERVTWHNFSVANGPGRSGALGTAEQYAWAEKFSYLFSAEDSHEQFHWNYKDIPATAPGDQFMMHTVNAHFEFDFLRSRFHGSIGQLRRVGDRVLVPDSDRPFSIRLRATPLTFECTKRDHTMTLQGLAPCSGRDCAVLSFWTWLDVTSRSGTPPEVLERPGFTQFDGHLLVDLEDGSLQYGYFNEWATLPAPGTTGKEVIRFYVEYEMERVPRASKPQQENESDVELAPSLFQNSARGRIDRSPNPLVASIRRRSPDIPRE